MKNEYYVYTHIRKDTNQVFYVGKGKGRRAFSSSQRNRHWKSIADKHGYDVAFVAVGLNEYESFKIEKETIAHFGRANLTNYTDGGDGASGVKKSNEFKIYMSEKMRGRIFSKETIEKMRQAAKNKNPEISRAHGKKITGRKLSQEHKEKISKSSMGRVLSEETRDKISKYHKGKKKKPDAVAKMAASKSKPVYCHNNGVTYKSMNEAARALSLKQSHISNVCTGKAKHTKGFIFSRS